MSGRQGFSGGVLLTLFVSLAGAIVISGKAEPRVQPGELIDRPRFARVSFTSLNHPATETARKKAASETPPVYQSNAAFIEETQMRLLKLPATVANVDFIDQLAGDIQTVWQLNPIALETLKGYLREGSATQQWENLVKQFIRKVKEKAFLEPERYQIELQNVARSIRLYDSANRYVLETDLVDVSDETRVAREIESLAADFPADIRRTLVSYFNQAKQPTYKFDQDKTDKDRKARFDAVPQVSTNYEPNQVLVTSGQVLDEDGYLLLATERQKYLDSLPAWARSMVWAGPLTLVILVSGAMVVCVFSLRPRIAQNPVRGLTLAGLLLLTLGAAWVMRPMGSYTLPAAMIAPAILAATILTIAYDQRIAMAMVMLHTILIGMTVGASLGLYVVTIVACLVMAAQLGELRRRGLLVRAATVTAVVVALGVMAVGFSERQYVPGVTSAVGYEARNAFLATLSVGFFVFGMLAYIEKAFKITTPLTLLELADMDHPLLRRLAQSAPGTFNHSLQVGMLAEAAAEAIGADDLLARVGGYYHDIGKSLKPEYFVENQAGGLNRHEKLSPPMSLLVIVAHVKDGVEMAREYRLPRPIHHFIEAHHGTTLVEYFYHEAKRKREDEPSELDFRYPGPKPRTREVAIVMIADAAESACRTLGEPTPTRIEQLVHKLASKRLHDGQFDECDITLNEVRKVVGVISKSLASHYHSRVIYPEDKAADTPEAQRVAG